MKVWIDAQLPPAMAVWMTEDHGVEASTLHPLGLRQAEDDEVFDAMRTAGAVIASKDEDFVDLVTRLSPPPQLLWITCGNVTNRVLRALMKRAFPEARRLLEGGEPIVELTEI